MSELDEMREELFKLLYPYADVKSGYGYALIEQILSLATDTCRIAVVRKKGELPETLIDELEYGNNTCHNFRWGVFAAQKDMLSAGYVKEVT